MAEEVAGAEIKEETAQAQEATPGDVGEVTADDSGAVDVPEKVTTGDDGSGDNATKEVVEIVVEEAGDGKEDATAGGENADVKETTEEEGGANGEGGVAGKEEEEVKEQEGEAKEQEGGAPDKEDGQEEDIEAPEGPLPDVPDSDKQTESEVGTLAGAADQEVSVTDSQSKEEHHTSVGGHGMEETELLITPDLTTAEITAAPVLDINGPMHRIESATTMTIDGVPVLMDIAEEEEETAEERKELVEKIKEAIEERDRLNTLNTQVQNEIAEYLARKKDDEKADPGRTAVDHEKKYFQCMHTLDALQESLQKEKTRSHDQECEMRRQRDRAMEELVDMKAEFIKYRKDNVLNVVDQRTGKKLTAKDIEDFQTAEEKKEQDIVQVRLESIKLQNKIAKLEGLIKQKDQLVGGLHLIDFEQLKINNVDLNEKIEERNDDILKLKKKVTSTVEVLTHVKEKLQFLQGENAEKKESLREVDTTVAMKRDHLTRMKRARDSLRADNLKLRQKGGLVGHTALLKDFEERQDQSKATYKRLEVLQKRQAELTVLCDGLKQKIEQAKYVSRQH